MTRGITTPTLSPILIPIGKSERMTNSSILPNIVNSILLFRYNRLVCVLLSQQKADCYNNY